MSQPVTELKSTKRLSELSRGERAVIVSVGDPAQELTRRLMEMGLLEGARVELLHEAPFGGDPIAVRVRGGLIALRRADARQIEVRQ